MMLLPLLPLLVMLMMLISNSKFMIICRRRCSFVLSRDFVVARANICIEVAQSTCAACFDGNGDGAAIDAFANC